MRSTEKNNNERNILDNPYVKFTYKAILAAFFLGGAVYRYENKMDQIGDKLIKKLDEHIISDSYEKQALKTEISSLRESLKDLQVDFKEYKVSEFIRPNETRIKGDWRSNKREVN